MAFVVESVPAVVAIIFFFARLPAIAKVPTIGRKRANRITKARLRLRNTVLALKPANAEPLFPPADEYAYRISESPCVPLLFRLSVIVGHIAMSVAVLLFIRYGASLVALQGLLLYDLLLYASVSDIRTRKAEDWAWIAMIPLALCSIPRIGILSMLLGAGIVFLPQLAMAVLPPHKTLGGADIKLSTASAFLLGAVRGVGGYLVGLLASVIFTLIYNKAKGRSNKNSYPLIPFLAVGVMAAFFI